MKKKLLLLFLLALGTLTLPAQVRKWGSMSDLSVKENYLVDAEGNQVMLHGVMDTPSPYFSGYRFTDGHYINVYTDGDNYVTKCINYFNRLFTAITDTTQGSWCNVFRLHLDPCWTDNPNLKASGFTSKVVTENSQQVTKYYDPNGTEVSGEANIMRFDSTRLKKYMSNLYIPIAKKAKAKGLYIIIRPPGVCPSTIKVGDYYQQYLMKVWDIVTRRSDVKEYSGWISIELANEPIAVLDEDGNKSKNALHDYFQPIVDKIRANGFKGIIWVPGATWQQDYRGYEKYPIVDPMKDDKGNSAQQIGYAVHFYPGWFSTSDSQYEAATSIASFLDGVPVVKTAPIMITEVDWSPEQSPKVVDHYNEYNQPVYKNCGTWATGTTSKFGKGYKAVIDYFGNIGWTLTHTHDYLDIDYYLSNSKVRPAFYTLLNSNPIEACSGACFQWYPQYARQQHVAREWEPVQASDILPMDESVNQAANLNGKVLFMTDADCEAILYGNTDLEGPQNLRSGSYEDIAGNPFCWLKFTRVTNAGCTTTGNLYTIQVVNELGAYYSVWGNQGHLNTPPGAWCLFALSNNSKYKYGTDADYYGLWKVDYVENRGYTIQNVGAKEAGQNSWLTPAASTPQAGKVYVHLFSKLGKKTGTLNAVNTVENDEPWYNLLGQKVAEPKPGMIYIRGGRKVVIR